MSNFWQRTITGIFFVLTIVLCTVLNEWSFYILLFAINFFCLKEFYQLMLPDKNWIEQYLGVIAGSIINIMFALIIRNDWDYGWFYHLIPVFLLMIIIKLFEKTKREFDTLAYQVLGIIYICFPLSMLADFGRFSSLTYDGALPIGFFIMLWTCDTGAYLVGRKFGKRKLFERISPKKTWEGSFGGAALVIIVAFLLSQFDYFDILDLHEWVIVGLITLVFGTFGDLTESLLKRNIDVKDSGTLLPGHGGVMDRFDGLFLAVPAVYFYLLFTN
jgi:phosphatidate cytidylyltransferase